MTLIADLEILAGSQTEAARIASDVSAVADNRQEAYKILVGVGQDGKIGFVRTLALLMKHEAECAGHCEVASGSREIYGPLLDRPQDLHRAFASFDDPEFQAVEHPDFVSLLGEMALLGLQRVRTDSAALQYVSDQWRSVTKQLAEADKPVADRYVAAKRRWLILNQKLLSLESVRREIAERAEHLQRDFLAIFSDEFLAERAARSRLEIAHLRLDILRENPGASAAMIEQIVSRRINEQIDTLRPDQMVANAGLRIIHPNDAQSTQKDYKRAVCSLRKLAMLVHPDRLSQIDLGWVQQEQLKAIWRDSNRYRAQRDNCAVLAQAASTIERQVQLAEQILALSGIDDLDASLTIQGVTLADQIDWLEAVNEMLGPQLVASQIDVHLMGRQPELNYFQAMINAPQHVQDEERSALTSNAEHYHQKSLEIERATESLLTAYA